MSTQFPFLKARRKATVEMVAAMAHMVTALNYPVVVVAYTVAGMAHMIAVLQLRGRDFGADRRRFRTHGRCCGAHLI